MVRQSGGIVQTVLGPIDPGRLGATLMHEHLLCDLTPPARRDLAMPEVEITLDNVFDVTWRPGDFHGNHRLKDVGLAMREAEQFKRVGGGTIVDVTTGGICPDANGLEAIAHSVGINIVLGAGFYTQPFVEADVRSLSTNALSELMVVQLTEGAWGTRVRCGIIGEIGCSWPLTPFERRSLCAAAQAQRHTGAAITIHPGRDRRAPDEILDILDAENADIGRVIIGHMDRTLLSDDDVVALARRTCIVEYDFFGIEQSNYWLGVVDLPTDWMRLRALRKLFDAGFGDRVVISHDICTRSRLKSCGGHGYGHILRNVVPLMRDRGFSQSEIDQVLIETPRRLLTLERVP